MQVLTVAAGGTLYQDLQSQKPNGINHSVPKALRHYPFHPVKIDTASKLYDIYQVEEIGVNSFHHQAVKDMGKGFKATMIAPDGIIEAIETEEERFVVAVQWHPEMMEGPVAAIRPIFSAFVEECKTANSSLSVIETDGIIA
jgi:putative glutamine amidotransferase